MKRIASMLIGALFVGAGFGIALAQEGAPPPAPPAAPPAAAAPAAPAAAAPAPAATQDHSDEVAAFHRMIRMHHRMWKRLKQNPNLVSDDSFVGKYPDLQVYLQKYPDAKEHILANPGLYLKYSEAKAMQREQTRAPGVP
jgi:hypothetical protein